MLYPSRQNLAGITLPILPVQILWVNMVSSVALSATLAFEPLSADTMRGLLLLHNVIAIVTLIDAAGINAFECEFPNGSAGINDCGTALWLTGMLMSTIGSDYFPKTAQGRVLCFLLALCLIALGGYFTATLATFFVSQEAESDQAEIAATQSIQALETEITALPTEVQSCFTKRFRPVSC
ncbi:ion channel [Microcoleus sp. Pol11C2]|uniref:ion channel n=1 Tax=Microcoleus sp. Pol11C2 TaxID=3055389 RepID=UPI002FD0FD5E